MMYEKGFLRGVRKLGITVQICSYASPWLGDLKSRSWGTKKNFVMVIEVL